MTKHVFDEFFRFMGFFCTVVIAYAFVKSGITDNPPEFPLSGKLLPWLLLSAAALVGAFVRQRKSKK
ncbi:hypothetical protein [Sphingorhabdus sp.]|uniref:hypothetical protein n=1 Tax=Sphingorhabdus sp. TaxID=1902408 RepID=UPI0035ADDB29|nr:hypothetical protein [Sphingomonadaceae bacterium]